MFVLVELPDLKPEAVLTSMTFDNYLFKNSAISVFGCIYLARDKTVLFISLNSGKKVQECDATAVK